MFLNKKSVTVKLKIKKIESGSVRENGHAWGMGLSCTIYAVWRNTEGGPQCVYKNTKPAKLKFVIFKKRQKN